MAYSVVPVNPKTGNIIKRPRKGQQVIFYARGPRGGMRKLSKHSQAFMEKDRAGVEAQIKHTTGGNFTLYQQYTKERFKPEDVKSRQARHKDVGNLKTKLTGPQPRNKQRPMFYVRGRQRRAIDLGFKKGHKVKPQERRPQIVASAGTLDRIAKTKSFFLYGETIKDALGRLQLDTILRNIKGKLLYYNLKMRVYEPKRGGGHKQPVDIPAAGAIIPGQEKYIGNMIVDGKMVDAMRGQISILANMKTQIAGSIRQALLQNGYMFTKKTKLKKLYNEATRNIKKLEKGQAPQEKIDAAMDARDRIYKPQQYSDLRHDKFRQITEKWKVEIFINFEIAG